MRNLDRVNRLSERGKERIFKDYGIKPEKITACDVITFAPMRKVEITTKGDKERKYLEIGEARQTTTYG